MAGGGTTRAAAVPPAVAAEEMWGTLEELLLAAAVRRHGAARWDSVAMEVRERIPAAKLLTGEGCERRYRLLQRRFAGFVAGGDSADDPAAAASEDVPWLEELRQLRVAELRRELERYDVSIMSLQLKVKRLKEERERDETDPVTGGDRKPDPEAVDDRRITVGSSGDSCKESNSTDPKPEEEVRRPGGEVTADPKPDLASAAGDEKSFNGSSGADPMRVAAESAGESKESSDVQSSASLSKRRQGKSVAVRVKPEAEAAPTIEKREDTVVKYEPLISVLDLIRSSEHAAIFERRLESQESQRYQSLIRRHVDLETLLAKLESGSASYSTAELFRDLLLLCTNAVVFFPHDSTEFFAAANIRSLVVKEMAAFIPPWPPKPPPPLPPPVDDENTPLVKLKQEIENDSLPAKKVGGLTTGPLVACRKRSSSASKAVKKEEKEKNVAKAMASKEEDEDGEDDGEEKEGMEKGKVEEVLDSPTGKKKDKEKPTKGLRTSKSRGGVSNSKNSNSTSNVIQSSESKSEAAASKAVKKSSNTNTTGISGIKKVNASPYMVIRAKQPVAVEEVAKSSGSGRSAETKTEKKTPTRAYGRRVESSGAATRRAVAAAAAAAEKNASSKRVGRPPKRAAAPVSKRGRDGVQTPPPARKRGRR